MDTERVAEAVVVLMDPRVERMGVSKLRTLTYPALRDIRRPIMVDGPHSDIPLAVIVPYRIYLEVQKALFGVY